MFDLQSNCCLFHRVECGDQGFQAVLASGGLTLWLALSQHVIGSTGQCTDGEDRKSVV